MWRSLGLVGVMFPWAGASAQGRMVEYPASARPQAHWKLPARPALEIGGADGEGPTLFSMVVGVARLANGSIVVGDHQSNEVRLFGAGGKFVRPIGRAGLGPGEFSLVWDVYARGDTVTVEDNQHRTSVFGPDGKLLRALGVPRAEGVARPRWLGFLEDGSGVLTGRVMIADTAQGEGRARDRVLISNIDASRQAVLFESPTAIEVRREGRRPMVPVYTASATFAARGDRVCGGYPVGWEIACYDAKGTRMFAVRRQAVARRITQADRAVAREARLDDNRANMKIPERAARIRESLRLMEFSSVAPAYVRVLLSAVGELWVGEFDPHTMSGGNPTFNVPRRSVPYHVIGGAGEWLATVELPPRFVPHDAGRDWVLGVTLDDDGVERVTLWRFKR